MTKDLKVAAIQSKVPKSKEEGEKQIKKLVAQAASQKVDFVGLPEDCVAKYDEVKNGYNAFPFLSSVAKENKICLFGATAVLEQDGLHDKGFLFDRDGKLVSTQDKIVLTPIDVENGFVAGNTIKVVDTEFGKVAILVCKDSFHRYAAWFFDEIRKAGADVVLIPSYSLNVSQRSIELWTDSLKSLAKWFDLYIIAPGTIGPNDTKFPSFGHALIISPSKVVLAEGSADKEEILYATLSAKDLEDVRNTVGSKWQPQEIPKFEIIKE